MSARILVVDDIEPNLRLLQAKLEARYYEVTLAGDGPSALLAARNTLPDIILLDVMMPGMDGFEVCKRLRADPATTHIPIVMITALSEMEHRVRGLEAGAEDFITKPFNDFELMTRIEALMRYNSVASELRQREASGVRSGVLDMADAMAAKRPASIVIVEEDGPTANRLSRTLREAGHKAATLAEAGGVEAGEGGVDIILLSLSGQSFDPLRLCAHFKIREDTRAIAVITICDPEDKDIGLKALNLGANDIIMTPVNRQELVARVATQARRMRYIDILRQRVDRGMELAVIDQLTGLYNRRYMMNQLSLLMQRAAIGSKPLSIILADIDHFKKVNDTYGHEAGDHVLGEFAKRLSANVRPMDIVCRHGGEEFAVIMPETAGDVACVVAERARRAVAAEPFEVDGVPVSLSVTVSSGVATLTPEDSVDSLIKRADAALYRAKSAGRNRVESVAA